MKDSSFAFIYKSLLDRTLNDPQFEASPRGMKIKELTHIQFELTDPLSCMYTNDRRSTQFSYVSGELLWYYYGLNGADFISNYSKFWTQIQNEDNIVNSAYGYMLFKRDKKSQWSWTYDSLVADKDTRQAILFFNTPSYQYIGNKDFPCTVYSSFDIRDNKLNFSVKMRSNDLILGLQADIVFFVTLQQHMLLQLQDVYPDLEMGSYYHYVDSLHIYERHFELVDNMLKDPFIEVKLNTLTEPLIGNTGESLPKINDFMQPWLKDKSIIKLLINEIIS